MRLDGTPEKPGFCGAAAKMRPKFFLVQTRKDPSGAGGIFIFKAAVLRLHMGFAL
jgi:hypothetical protein